MYDVCLSAFAYSVVSIRVERQAKLLRIRNYRLAAAGMAVYAAVIGLGAFSGYQRRPQLKHTY
jgi:hypothetical protein